MIELQVYDMLVLKDTKSGSLEHEFIKAIERYWCNYNVSRQHYKGSGNMAKTTSGFIIEIPLDDSYENVTIYDRNDCKTDLIIQEVWRLSSNGAMIKEYDFEDSKTITKEIKKDETKVEIKVCQLDKVINGCPLKVIINWFSNDGINTKVEWYEVHEFDKFISSYSDWDVTDICPTIIGGKLSLELIIWK